MSLQDLGSVQEQQWLSRLKQALIDQTLQRVILSQYEGELPELLKITLRPIELQQQQKLSALYHYKTQDVTKNYALDDTLETVSELLAHCKQANLFVDGVEIQLKKNKKKHILTQSKHQKTSVESAQHNREKQRLLDQQQHYLQDLGITDHQHKVIPSMAKKWKQINKFIEIFSNSVQHIDVQDRALHVVDFGSGKGYLTFAMYDYLQQSGKHPHMTGVELRDNLVEFCQNVANKNQFQALDFFQGDVRSYQPEHLDVMVALHACDIATDFAIHCGIRLNASMIMCAPCCHKELRPQLKSPEILKPMLQYGVYQAQQAEMLTDTLRALLLNAHGYETKVFEFISTEHTSKNKMILAIKKQQLDVPDAQIMQKIEALKRMYGIQQQSLQRLLQNEMVDEKNLGERC
ncbi:MAG: SAM-dependent methyltransferase [Acinetobacter sp.]